MPVRNCCLGCQGPMAGPCRKGKRASRKDCGTGPSCVHAGGPICSAYGGCLHGARGGNAGSYFNCGHGCIGGCIGGLCASCCGPSCG